MMLLLVGVVFAAFRSDEDIQMMGNSIINASNVSANYIYMNGSLLISNGSLAPLDTRIGNLETSNASQAIILLQLQSENTSRVGEIAVLRQDNSTQSILINSNLAWVLELQSQNTSRVEEIAILRQDNTTQAQEILERLELTGGTLTGLLNINADLNVSENVTIAGYIFTGNSSKGLHAYFNKPGDIYVSGAILLEDAIFSFPLPYGTNVALMENEDTIEITSVGGTGWITADSQEFCDSIDPFDANDEGNYLTVISSVPSFAYATGEIKDYINSTCITVSFGSAGGATIVDATDATYIVYPAPTFSVLDNGDIQAQIGENSDASFKISILNGTNTHGVHIVDVVGADGHSALEIEQDIDNKDGAIGLKLFTDSDTGISATEYSQISQEIRLGGINNSVLAFIDINVIGEGTNNEIDLIHITGEVDHIIEQGSADILNIAYVQDRDQTYNFTTNGAGAVMFENDNDFVYIGSTVNFTQISFALSTHASVNIRPKIWYCNTSGTYEPIGAGTAGVTDTTDGMQVSGSFSFINPSDRGTCNQEFDGTPFADPTNYTYVAIKRRKNTVVTNPIESLVTIGGSQTLMLLQKDMLKLDGSNGGPVTCSASYAGAWYYDSTAIQLLWCNGVSWVTFATTNATITNHNSLAGLQGGTSAEYYHLTQTEYETNMPTWDSAYANLVANQSKWDGAYDNLVANQSKWDYAYDDLIANQTYWNTAYNNLVVNQSGWDETEANVLANQSVWASAALATFPYANLTGKPAFDTQDQATNISSDVEHDSLKIVTGASKTLLLLNQTDSGNVDYLVIEGAGVGSALYIKTASSGPAIRINATPSHKAIEIHTDDKICLDGDTCGVFINHNTTVLTSQLITMQGRGNFLEGLEISDTSGSRQITLLVEGATDTGAAVVRLKTGPYDLQLLNLNSTSTIDAALEIDDVPSNISILTYTGDKMCLNGAGCTNSIYSSDAGDVNLAGDGYIFNAGNVSLGSAIGDSFLYFYDDSPNPTKAEALYWNEGEDRFQLTDDVYIAGSLTVEESGSITDGTATMQDGNITGLICITLDNGAKIGNCG